MSTTTGSTLNDIPISVVVNPPPHILAGNNVKIPAVVKYGPMLPNQAPSELHGMLYLVDATTNLPIKGDRAAISIYGLAKTAVAVQEERGFTSLYLLFHDVTFPKSGRYRIAVSIFQTVWDIVDDEMVPAAMKLGDVQTGPVNVGQVGGDETHTAEEQGIIDMLAGMGVSGAR